MANRKIKRILGLDLSIRQPGLAVVELRGDGLFLSYASTITTDDRRGERDRYDHIAAWLRFTLHEQRFNIDEIAREMTVRSRNMHTTRALFGVRAISEYVLRGTGIPVFDYTPKQVKKTLTGDGDAPKTAVLDAVLRYIPGAEFSSLDESDAAAVVIHHLLATKQITRG